VAVYCKDRTKFRGTFDARSGATSGTLQGSNGGALGSVYLDSPLIASVSYGGVVASGYAVDVRFNVSRVGPVQVIETIGKGNGSRASDSNDTAIVRGRWRVGYKNSGM
jgi:hypothetical protein